MEFNQIVEDVIRRLNIKQNVEVVELYLGNHKLESVDTLEKYKLLQRIWLNGNKLRNLFCPITEQSFLKNNFRITELYLQNNDLCDIIGTISHLRYLQVLMLQKNQLASLSEVLQETNRFQALGVLNLFDNPLAQERGYRLLVIHTLPSVKLLDRREVTDPERKKAREIHEPDQEAIRALIAFNRRATINPALLHTYCKPPKKYHAPLKKPKVEHEVPKEKVSRSVMQYTTFDWSRVPTSQQRRLGQPVLPLQNLTVKLK